MSKRINLGKVAFTDRGVYSSSATYVRLDFVSDGISTFYSRKDGNTGNALPTSASEADTNEWWGFLANVGDAKAIADAAAASAKATAEAAASEAKATAAEAAADIKEHMPKIVDGYWQLWDYENSAYEATSYKATGKSPHLSDTDTWVVFDDDSQTFVDTGVSASSGYVLTKEKVESVLTGDIATHTHDERYYTKDEVDAKTTLTAGENITISDGTISAKDTTYEEATSSAAGLMSAEDKAKLDGLEELTDDEVDAAIDAAME